MDGRDGRTGWKDGMEGWDGRMDGGMDGWRNRRKKNKKSIEFFLLLLFVQCRHGRQRRDDRRLRPSSIVHRPSYSTVCHPSFIV